MDISLSELYFRCHRSFQAALSAFGPQEHGPDLSKRDVESEFDKFRLWAGNVGAMHTGQRYKLSLDYRLRESPFYRERVTSFLNTLDQKLNEVARILLQEEDPLVQPERDSSASVDDPPDEDDELQDSPWEVSSNESSSDSASADHALNTQIAAGIEPSTTARLLQVGTSRASINMETIRFLIDCLYKMPIRTPAGPERLKIALSGPASYYQHFDALYVQDLFPQLDTMVAIRLGKLISLRRQILVYRESHDRHLKSDAPEATSFLNTASSHDTSVHDTTKAPVSETDQRQTSSQVQSHQASIPSNATTHRHVEPHVDTDNPMHAPSEASSEASRASRYAVSHLQVHIPPMPKGIGGQTSLQFVCPLCSCLQSFKKKDERAWKRHVFDDLQPYVCTYSGCDLEDRFFPNRKEWYQHEAVHRSGWHCNVENHPQFAKETDFANHMAQEHDSVLTEQQTPQLRSMFKKLPQSFAGRCNLCFRHSENLRSHVSRHLQRLALFALPRTNDDANLHSAEAQESEPASASKAPDGSQQDEELSSAEISVSSSKETENILEDVHEALPMDEILEQVQVPDSEDPEWDLVTEKFVIARGTEKIDSSDAYDRPDSPSTLAVEDIPAFKTALLHEAEQNTRLQMIVDPAPGTFGWIWANDYGSRRSISFMEWLHGDRQLFWIYGKSGSGKSTLLKFISQKERLASKISPTKSVCVLRYFYWYVTAPKNDGQRELAMSILLQILRQYPFMNSTLQKNIDFESLSSNQLREALNTVLQNMKGFRLLLFIDALDESQESYVSLFAYLLDLVDKHPHLKLCASSRRPISGRGFLIADVLRIEDHTTEDVKTYLRTSPLLDEEDISTAVAKAQGSFLWVLALLRLLQERDLPSAPTVLEYCPDDLEILIRRVFPRQLRIFDLFYSSKTIRFSTVVALETLNEVDCATSKTLLAMNIQEFTAHVQTEHTFFFHGFQDDKTGVSPGLKQITFSNYIFYEIAIKRIKQPIAYAGIESWLLFRSRVYLRELDIHTSMQDQNVSMDSLIAVLQDLGSTLHSIDSLNITDPLDELLNTLKKLLLDFQLSEAYDNIATRHRNHVIIERTGRPESWNSFVIDHDLANYAQRHLAQVQYPGVLNAALRLTSNQNEFRSPNPTMVELLLKNPRTSPNARFDFEYAWSRFLGDLWKFGDNMSVEDRDKSFRTVQIMLSHGADRYGDIKIVGPEGAAWNARELLQNLFSRSWEEICPAMQEDIIPDDFPPVTPSQSEASDEASPRSEIVSDSGSEPKAHICHRVVNEARFTLEDYTEADDGLEVVLPSGFEDIADSPTKIVLESEIENLRLQSDSDEDEQARIYRRKKKRWSAGVYTVKRDISMLDAHGSSDDDDDDSLKGLKDDYDGSVRRLRRRLRGPNDRSSTIFEDQGPVTTSSEDQFVLTELPFYDKAAVDFDSPDYESP